LYQQETTKKQSGHHERKKYSPLVEINSVSTLQQLQDGLIENGHGLQELLEAVYPDADAVCSAIEEIKFQLQDHPVNLSDQWVTAHDKVGDKKRFISKRLAHEVSMSLLFCFNCALYAFTHFFLSCLGDIAGNPRLRASFIRPLQ
jgi:hypothetical protein